MLRVALTMLVNERGKYFGIVAALSFTAFMMVQQPAIFLGILARSTAVVTDLPIVDLWVMDPKVENVDDAKPLADAQLYRVKGIAGVEWAVPFYRGTIKARLDDGNFLVCQLIAIDDVTLIGGPNEVSVGSLTDLRSSDAVLVDETSAHGRLAGGPGSGREISVGATLELNDKRASVVGFHRGTPSFQSQPVIYTTYTRAKAFLPSERKLLSYILVKVKDPAQATQVASDITRFTGLAAYTSAQFRQISIDYFLFRSGVFLNFAVSAIIAFVIGGGIAGQTFYNFTLDNIRYFGVLKAMGAQRALLVGMILLQAATVGTIGFGLGAGAVALFTQASTGSPIAMSINPWVLGGSFAVVMLVILGAAAFSARPVVRLEPAAVFRG
ncbi:ABC transporter permease [Reyranella sp.]|uniref:ABC transporter permease n=1 Tax=Reyranella sp. TaxID=1929291 RepID=UPI003BA99682